MNTTMCIKDTLQRCNTLSDELLMVNGDKLEVIVNSAAAGKTVAIVAPSEGQSLEDVEIINTLIAAASLVVSILGLQRTSPGISREEVLKIINEKKQVDLLQEQITEIASKTLESVSNG